MTATGVDGHLFWFASRALGIVAVVGLSLTVSLGLAMSGRLLRRPGLPDQLVQPCGDCCIRRRQRGWWRGQRPGGRRGAGDSLCIPARQRRIIDVARAGVRRAGRSRHLGLLRAAPPRAGAHPRRAQGRGRPARQSRR